DSSCAHQRHEPGSTGETLLQMLNLGLPADEGVAFGGQCVPPAASEREGLNLSDGRSAGKRVRDLLRSTEASFGLARQAAEDHRLPAFVDVGYDAPRRWWLFQESPRRHVDR